MSNDFRAFCRFCGAALYPNYMEGCWEHFSEGCEFSGKRHLGDGNETKSNWDPIAHPSRNGTADFAVFGPFIPQTKRERMETERKGHALVSAEQLLLIEWVDGHCPACGRSKVIRHFIAQDEYTDFPGRHSGDCWLAAAIKEAQRE